METNNDKPEPKLKCPFKFGVFVQHAAIVGQKDQPIMVSQDCEEKACKLWNTGHEDCAVNVLARGLVGSGRILE